MSALWIAVQAFALLIAGTYAIAIIRRWTAFGSRVAGKLVVSPYVEARSLLRQRSSPAGASDDLLFRFAPLVALIAVALAALVIPLGPRSVAFDPSIGVFYFIVVLGPFVIAMFCAGWSQNSKVGLFGAFRAATCLLAYEVPLGFAAIGPVMDAGSLSTLRIVAAQASLWYVVWQPLGLAIYIVSALMMSYAHPFDIPQSEAELGGGVLAEYSGARLLLFRLALDALFLLLMAMGVVLFLGGGNGPLLALPVWFVLKTAALAAFTLWLSRRAPRLRHDQMLALSWKILLPAALINIALVGVLALLL
jgi:NADH-quinone oxidoreductase subunit H